MPVARRGRRRRAQAEALDGGVGEDEQQDEEIPDAGIPEDDGDEAIEEDEGEEEEVPPGADNAQALQNLLAQMSLLTDASRIGTTQLLEMAHFMQGIKGKGAACRIKVQKLNLDEGSKEGSVPPFVKVSVFKRTFADYATENKIAPEDWTKAAAHFLEGRVQATYQRKYEANHERHLTWDEFVRMLDDLVVGTKETPFEALNLLVRFRLEGEEPNWRTSLGQAVADMERLMDQFPNLPEAVKCFFLYHAAPGRMRTSMRYDLRSGINKEWEDYARMKDHVMTLQGIFSEYVREVKDTRKKERPAAGNKRNRAEVEVHAAANENHRLPPPPPVVDAHMDKEPRDKRAQYRSGDTFWVRGMTPQKKQRLFNENRCLLCEKTGHGWRECRSMRRMFEAGDAYYYARSMRTK